MKILVDVTERKNLGKQVIDKNKLSIQKEKLIKQILELKSYKNKLNELSMNSIESSSSKLTQDLINLNNQTYFDEENMSLEDKIHQMNKQVNQIDDILFKSNHKHEFPSFISQGKLMNLDIQERNLNKYISQGDFLIECDDGYKYMIELSATFMTLQDKIENSQPLIDSFKLARSKNLAYRFLLVLPPKDKLEDYIWRSKFTLKSYLKFRKLLKENHIPTIKLEMNELHYFQPGSQYFTSPENEVRLRFKLDSILNVLVSLNEKRMRKKIAS